MAPPPFDSPPPAAAWRSLEAADPFMNKTTRPPARWITGCFVLAALAGAFFHEWWLDEAQGFLIARDSTTLAALWDNTRPEGHPLLWYLLIWMLTRFTTDVVFFQLVQIAISAVTVYRIARWSPFSTAVVWVLPFTYLLFFESTLLFRSYALGLCLLVVALTQDRGQRGWAWKAGSCLALSLQVHWLFALPGAVYATACWQEIARSRRAALGFLFPLGASLMLLGIQMITADVSWYVNQQAAGATGGDVRIALASPLTGVLTFPDPTRIQNFNSTVWRHLPFAIAGALAALAWLLPVGLLWRHSWPLTLATLAGQGALAFFILLTHHYATRIAGFHWWILLTALWLAMERAPDLRWRRALDQAVLLIALVQVLGNGVAVVNDIRHPFTASRAAAEAISHPPLADLPVTTASCEATELAPYIRRQPYAMCSQHAETFCHWRQTCSIMDQPHDLAMALAAHAAVQADFLFASWTPVPAETLSELSTATVPLRLEPLLSIDDTIVRYGSLHVYRIRREQADGVRPRMPEQPHARQQAASAGFERR